MKRFKDKELEIAVLTRNRSDILEVFLEKQIKEIEGINAILSIYDTSSNNDTENIVKRYQNDGHKIIYDHGAYEKSIEDKYLDAILNSKAKYLWIMGDSNYMDIPLFSEKSYDSMMSGCELIVAWNDSVSDREYDDVAELFADCLWHMTWMGGLVFRRDIYKESVTIQTKNQIVDLAKTVKGSWYPSLGILFEALIRRNRINTKLISLKIHGLASVEKKQAWVSEAYKVWCKDLCLLVDCFADSFGPTADRATRVTWEKLGLDKGYWSCRFRASNSLNRQIFDEYDSKGYINRVSQNRLRIKKWAYMPQLLAEGIYRIYKNYFLLKPCIKKLLKR